MSVRITAVTVTAALCATPAAFAHHSTALVYERDGALIEVEGTIMEVAWVNPHVRFKLRGVGPDGVDREWDIESNSVSTVSEKAGRTSAGNNPSRPTSFSATRPLR